MSVIAFPGRETRTSTPQAASVVAVTAARLVEYGFADNPMAAPALIVDPRPILEAVAEMSAGESVAFVFERGRRWTFSVQFESARADAGDMLATLLRASAPSARFKPVNGATASAPFARKLVPRGEALAAFTRSNGQDQSITLPAPPASPSDLGVALKLASEAEISQLRIVMRPRPLDQSTQFLLGAALNRGHGQIAWPGSRHHELHKQLDAWMSARRRWL